MDTQLISDTQENSMITLFDSHDEAEKAILELQENGYDMKKLSIIALNLYSTETVKGFYGVSDRVKDWAETGAFWGGFWGLLFGAATLSISGIGPALVAGPLGALLMAAEGAITVGGLSALGAALASIGIPKHKIIKYETEIKAGKYMLVIHGNNEQLENARSILNLHIPKQNLEYIKA